MILWSFGLSTVIFLTVHTDLRALLEVTHCPMLVPALHLPHCVMYLYFMHDIEHGVYHLIDANMCLLGKEMAPSVCKALFTSVVSLEAHLKSAGGKD